MYRFFQVFIAVVQMMACYRGTSGLLCPIKDGLGLKSHTYIVCAVNVAKCILDKLVTSLRPGLINTIATSYYQLEKLQPCPLPSDRTQQHGLPRQKIHI